MRQGWMAVGLVWMGLVGSSIGHAGTMATAPAVGVAARVELPAATDRMAESHAGLEQVDLSGAVDDGGEQTQPRWVAARAGQGSTSLQLVYLGTVLLGGAAFCVWRSARAERRKEMVGAAA